MLTVRTASSNAESKKGAPALRSVAVILTFADWTQLFFESATKIIGCLAIGSPGEARPGSEPFVEGRPKLFSTYSREGRVGTRNRITKS